MRRTTYRHATLRQYLPRILAEGLDPACATGKQPLVWLHTPNRTQWAITHTMQRHRVARSEVVILDVQVPRSWLRRAWRGLWMCPRVIPPERLCILDNHLET
jgi:hypothetical protein